MKKLICLGLLAFISALPSHAQAQSCSSGFNLEQISHWHHGGDGIVMDVTLDDFNKTEFLLWQDPDNIGAVAWEFTDLVDMWPTSAFTEDSNGDVTFTVSGYGVSLQCDNSGGVTVFMNGPDIPMQAFTIASTGAVTPVTAPIGPCACSGNGGSITCSPTDCAATVACRWSGSPATVAGYCQPGTRP